MRYAWLTDIHLEFLQDRKAVGDILRKFMSTLPDHRMTVLCGHSHSSGQVTVLPNLVVKTGGAEYGSPKIQEILDIANNAS